MIMPIFEFECRSCGHRMEILVNHSEIDLVVCSECCSKDLKKLISAHAPIQADRGVPVNPSDRCCGSDGPPASCAGPGSCCGKLQGV
jgi:putative FmdB family regulatory protein